MYKLCLILSYVAVTDDDPCYVYAEVSVAAEQYRCGICRKYHRHHKNYVKAVFRQLHLFHYKHCGKSHRKAERNTEDYLQHRKKTKL